MYFVLNLLFFVSHALVVVWKLLLAKFVINHINEFPTATEIHQRLDRLTNNTYTLIHGEMDKLKHGHTDHHTVQHAPIFS